MPSLLAPRLASRHATRAPTICITLFLTRRFNNGGDDAGREFWIVTYDVENILTLKTEDAQAKWKTQEVDPLQVVRKVGRRLLLLRG